MSQVIHTEQCIAAQMALEEYTKKWPDYCKSCGALGYTVFYETHGLPGIGEPMADTCSCIEDGLCPRCAKPTMGAGDNDNPPETCSSCGWEVEKPDSVPVYECLCGVAEEMEEMDCIANEYDANRKKEMSERGYNHSTDRP